MSKSKQRNRRRRSRSSARQRGGIMRGMRTGFKGVTGAVTGDNTGGRYQWVGWLITALLVAAAVGLLVGQL